MSNLLEMLNHDLPNFDTLSLKLFSFLRDKLIQLQRIVASSTLARAKKGYIK